MARRLALILLATCAACASSDRPAAAAPGPRVLVPAPVAPTTSPTGPASAVAAADVVPSAVADIAPAAAALGPVTAPDGRILAVVSLIATFEECSGMGGEHDILAVDGAAGAAAAAPALVHAGGHGVHLQLGGDPPIARLAGDLAGPPAPAPPRWFVAELSNVPRPSEDHDGNPDSSVGGWCLDRMPATGGEALRLIPASDRDAARRLLAALAATGLPRAHAVLHRATGATTLAIVRIRQRFATRTDPRYAIDVVDGPALVALDLPAVASPRAGVEGLEPWTGDLLVVELDGGAAPRATQALVADDLADARRWQAAIAGGGWPPRALVSGWSVGAAVTRWSAQGVIVAGTRGCGPELTLDTWVDSRFSIAPPRVAAPAGVKVGDRVTAVVVPQPADRCGRAVRAVRAWVTPGQTQAAWVVAGEPAPTPELP